jgi:hypothetical protein
MNGTPGIIPEAPQAEWEKWAFEGDATERGSADDLSNFSPLTRDRPVPGTTLSLKTLASVGTSSVEVKTDNDLGDLGQDQVFDVSGDASVVAAGFGAAAYVVQKCRPHFGHTQN